MTKLKTYSCPFCGVKYNRLKLAHHIEKKHDHEVPNDLTPHQVAYDIINNHPDHKGKCVVCGSPTNWNKKTQKYFRICKNPKCADEIKKTYQNRMLKVYNKIYLTDDPEHQKKMLSHRRISGKYKWSDGKMFDYVGSYERRFLEFLDQVLEYDSSDIITPGPVLEYEFQDRKRSWITDCLIMSLNLIVEIKDGGDNLNKAIDPASRQKQIAKEKLITSQGTYNYLRLTNNDFGQLLSCIAEIKMNTMEDRQEPIYRIHESTQDIELDRTNILCEIASFKLEEYMNNHEFPVTNVYAYKGIYNEGESDIASIAIVYPDMNSPYNFLPLVESYIKELNSYMDTEDIELSGSMVDTNDENKGYIIGVKL